MNSAYSEMVELGKLVDEQIDLEWTMYRVGNLSNAEGEVKTGFVGGEGWSLVSYRPGIAEWILEQIRMTVSGFVREKPALSSSKTVA